MIKLQIYGALVAFFMNYYNTLLGITKHLINISNAKDISSKGAPAMCFRQRRKEMALFPAKERITEMLTK